MTDQRNNHTFTEIIKFLCFGFNEIHLMAFAAIEFSKCQYFAGSVNIYLVVAKVLTKIILNHSTVLFFRIEYNIWISWASHRVLHLKRLLGVCCRCRMHLRCQDDHMKFHSSLFNIIPLNFMLSRSIPHFHLQSPIPYFILPYLCTFAKSK